MNRTDYYVGQTVYCDFGRHSTIDVRKGTVMNVSPSGVARVDFGTRIDSFLPNGKMRGADRWAPFFLHTDETRYNEELRRMNVQNAEKLARDRIAIANGCNLRSTNRADIIAKLEAAIAAVKAIPYGDA